MPSGESSRPTASSPRCRASRSPRSSSLRRRSACLQELVRSGRTHPGTGRTCRPHSRRPGPDRRGRFRRPHRQSPRHYAGADAAGLARSHAGAVWLRGAVACRRRGRHRHAGVGRGRLRDGRRLRADRLGQPGVRRIGQFGRGPRNARRRPSRPTRSWRPPPICSRWASRCRC